ncbi:MAG: hypothetical protein ACLR2E_07425 [Lachnospiraceae bacterium]
MAFDECPAECRQTGDYMQNSVERTYRWLVRCKNEMDRLNSLAGYHQPPSDAFRHQPGRYL